MSASNHHPNQTVSISPREDYLGPSYWTIGNPGAYEPPTLIQPHQENLLFSSPPNIHGSLESQVGLNVHIDGQRTSDIGHNAFRSGVRSNTVNKEFDLEVGKNPTEPPSRANSRKCSFGRPGKFLSSSIPPVMSESSPNYSIEYPVSDDSNSWSSNSPKEPRNDDAITGLDNLESGLPSDVICSKSEIVISVPPKSRKRYFPNSDTEASPLFPKIMGNAKSSNVAHTATPTHIMEESQEAFRQLLPLLKSVDASNSDGLLVTFLKEYHSEVPLASLYHLLYTSDSPDDIPPLSIPDSDFDQPDVSARTTKGLQLCHFILEAFKSPETFQGGIVHNPTLGTVNFHEFLRSFLAIKILFGSLKQVEKPNMSVSRVSLYKVYYILCQKLIHKSHNDSESWRSQQSIIFGESKMGKIFKLVYPNSKKKRLGKRGESKLHYVGFKWNDSMVDDEIRSLLNLELPDIMKRFKNTASDNAHKRKHRKVSTQRNTEESGMFSSTPRPPPLPLLKKPLYSFVDVFSTYPCWGFSPRIWTAAGDSVPKQSVWAKGCMDRSVELLKAYSVDLTPLVRNIGAGIFSGNGTKSITQAVIESMELLSICASPNDACLHLYLVVILVIFPVILASDQEVSCEAKASLRSDLKACVAHLETDVAEWESVDRKSLRNFTRILRMMTHLNQMTSSQVPPKCARSVMAEMVHDINLQGKKNGCPGEVSPMESMLFRAVITAVNAYNVTLTEDGTNSEFDTIQKIENIVKVIWKETMLTTEALQTIIDKEDIASNVPYQVFTIFGTTFHNVTVSYPETAKLPVQVVTCMVQHFTKDMQDARFRQFGKLEQDLCTETFRCWWIFSSMFQEYVSVISEVVALSQTVS